MANLGKSIARATNEIGARRSRELALQGLYAWQLAGDNARACNPSSRV